MTMSWNVHAGHAQVCIASPCGTCFAYALAATSRSFATECYALVCTHRLQSARRPMGARNGLLEAAKLQSTPRR